ncbi:MAG: hypothetical protein Q9166_006133 [cf. Caloplaca sp. 2 TL-2023]
MAGLKINSIPFRPSLLRNGYTPRSPLSPLESIAKRVCYSPSISSLGSASESTSSIHSKPTHPPRSPYRWIWQCHECHTSYQIGTTRRCLLDGHELCYGQPTKKRSKKGKKKVRTCQSQFDYAGWQAWGAWKRAQINHDGQENENLKRNCLASCDWPSQCRWSRQKEQVVEQTCLDQALEATSQNLTTPASPTSEEDACEPPKSNDSSLISKISSRWSSLLTPIEEEPSVPDTAAIENFLSLAKTEVEPSVASEQINVAHQETPSSGAAALVILKTSREKTVTRAERSHLNPSTADKGYSVLGHNLDLDFGFHLKAEEGVVPSLKKGLKELVTCTTGIALSTPVHGKRCIEGSSSPSVPLQEQLQGARRLSM